MFEKNVVYKIHNKKMPRGDTSNFRQVNQNYPINIGNFVGKNINKAQYKQLKSNQALRNSTQGYQAHNETFYKMPILGGQKKYNKGFNQQPVSYKKNVNRYYENIDSNFTSAESYEKHPETDESNISSSSQGRLLEVLYSPYAYKLNEKGEYELVVDLPPMPDKYFPSVNTYVPKETPKELLELLKRP